MKTQCIKIYGRQLSKYLGGKKSSQINQLWFHFKKLVKEEKIKPKVNRRDKIIKVKARII